MKKAESNIKELDLNGKVSVITGGTSGIGLAIAKSFFMHNSIIVIIGRHEEIGFKAVKQITTVDSAITGKKNSKQKDADESISEKANEENPSIDRIRKVVFFKCDVGNHDEVRNTCEKILSNFGRADILVLNAGIEFPEAINEVKPEIWQKMLDVNLSGAFYFVRYLSSSMIEQASGNVIILSSVAAKTGAGAGVHYAITKSALNGLMARINYELLPKGIRSNIISPGMVDTPMLRRKYPDTDEINKKLVEEIPIARLAKPEDIAKLALFLASDMSSYICGQNILIDGGRLFYKRPQ